MDVDVELSRLGLGQLKPPNRLVQSQSSSTDVCQKKPSQVPHQLFTLMVLDTFGDVQRRFSTFIGW